MQLQLLLLGTLSLVSAYTKPQANPTWNALRLPDLTHPVTKGKPFTVTWDGTPKKVDGVTVSLVLCRGNSNTCKVDDKALVEKVPASQKSWTWNVPCDLKPGTAKTDSGYGMLVIVDGTGEFQYSTQFSVLDNAEGCKKKAMEYRA
ncbi:hypothetical protein HII31_13347 [Pseudocercospora fuligena]|uniref:Yeast cell wall synthesis Kre9/Knh1-like N-terminal domain-containing protein n=1 Tax=Pseudocercospora fuligena TaxID=685502 RepID=A0A8H6VAS9_9PEZI|nr:hypothetical protein HII31_13347 [Pseudocercospora fuligena]